jgi:predicted MPP superfamily phosphohydrolase
VKVGDLSPPVHHNGHTYDHLHGWTREGTKAMFVAAGIGTSVVPMRFNVPPEIALITLRSNAV